MIEILKGNPHIVRKHFKCKYCNSEWLCNGSDYQVSREFYDRFNAVYKYGYFYIMRCPICGRKLYIEENDPENLTQ